MEEYMQISCTNLLAVALLIISGAFAQSETATLSGTTLDPQNLPVSAVQMELRNAATGLVRTASTTATGSFVFTFLAPGAYRLTAKRTGYLSRRVESIELNVNDRKLVEIEMPPAQGPERIEVVDSYNAIQSTSSVGTLVDRKFVENLPLNGRSFHSLIMLTPGVNPTPATQRNPGQFSVNGQRTSTNAFSVDGVSANFGIMAGPAISAAADGVMPALSAAGGTNSLVSVDAMQEFQVQTSSFAAEFGRSPGGQISIVTRSGTNAFHGTLFNYFRNDKMDANDFFANRDGLPRAPVRQNDFGGVAGGPVRLPKLYDGRNRTFFFFSYEGLRLRQPQFATDAYPNAAARLRAAPAAQRLVNSYPIPNREDLGGGFGRFAATYSNPLSLDSTSLRVDHQLTGRINIFGRFLNAPSESGFRGAAQGYDLSLATLNKNTNDSRTLTLGSTQTLSAFLLNEVRFNYSHNVGAYTTSMDNFGGAMPIPDAVLFPSFTNRVTGSAGILPVGLRGFAVGNLANNRQTQWNLVDNFSFSRAQHQYKMGFDYRRLTPEVLAPLYQQFGVFVGLEGPVGILGGRASAALVGAFDGLKAAVTNFSWYVQDTWRLHPRLTLTYGVRWDYNPAPVGLDNRPIYTAQGIENPRTATLAPVGTPLFEARHNNFAPRLGLAYRLSNRPGREMVLRGGYGIFYDLPLGGLQAASGNPPYRRTLRYANVPYPLPADLANPAPVTTTGRFDTVYAFASNFRQPFVQQFNVTLEQSLGRNRTFTGSYVGAVGRRLLRRETISQPRAFQVFDTLQITRSAADSDYHGLQLQFVERLRRGLQVLMSYTWAHSIDSASDNVSLVLPTTTFDQRLNRASSDYDLRQVFSGAVTYDLPFARHALVRNWGVDSVFRMQSALPVDVFNRTATLLGNYDLRPNRVDGVPLYLAGDGYPGGRVLNRAAFAIPIGQQTHGNLGRNTLRGFPLLQVDFTLRRQFNFGERANLQFRAELFNVFNHPSFGAPDGNLTNRLFGVSTQMFGRGLGQGGVNGGLNPLYAIGAPRSAQLALKLRW